MSTQQQAVEELITVAAATLIGYVIIGAAIEDYFRPGRAYIGAAIGFVIWVVIQYRKVAKKGRE
jgi:preprotein translocase subunit Sss1